MHMQKTLFRRMKVINHFEDISIVRRLMTKCS
jgi:hypothetical protein